MINESLREKHCATCICGRRAPVQATRSELHQKGPGSISWEEHLLAYAGYSHRYGTSQTAERMAERGGFDYAELVMFLGRAPTTWDARR